MNIGWSDVKDLFFVVGSLAGVAALLRPVLETKFARDVTRVERIRSLVNEQALVDLEFMVDHQRQVPAETFHPFDQLGHELRTKQDCLRFSGPTAKYLTREVEALVAAYEGLREYIQVDEWEPTTHTREDGTAYTSWNFNKAAFAKETPYPKGYAEHLAAAGGKTVEMRKAYQRFQLAAELHLFETPLAGWLLSRRFKSHGLCDRA
jgi:hypothetical protein